MAEFFSVLTGAFLLCIQAFYNGFPFVYPDSGTYIGACFEHTIPSDRPITYPFFIRHISLSETLWLPVIVQSAILSWLIFLLFKNLAKTRQVYAFHLGTIALLSLCTGAGLIAGQLIADIFTPILVLAGMLILFGKDISRIRKIFLLIIFSFSVAMHFSHFPLTAGLCMLAAIIAFRKRKKHDSPWQMRKLITAFAALAGSVLLIISLNLAVGGKAKFSPEGNSVFFINRLIDCHILGDYLEKNCAEKKWSLCGYGRLEDFNFIWNDESPVYKEYGPGMQAWQKAKPEYDSIIRDVFSNKEYTGRFAWCCFRDASAQLIHFRSGCSGPSLKGSAPWNSINWHFPESEKAYLGSRQNQQQLEFPVINLMQTFLVIFSLVVFSGILLIRRTRNSMAPELKAGLFWLILAILINAFSVVTFAMIDDRFQARLIWLLPLYLAVLISNPEIQGAIRLLFRNKRDDQAV